MTVDHPEGIAIPNYKEKCCCCDSSPVAVIKSLDNGKEENSEMCGVCFFGEAACIDPEEW